MEQYIDKDALVAEINRVLNSYDPNEITSGRYALISLRDFLDTLEVKEVDLEQGPGYWKGKYFKLKEQMQALVDSRDDTIKEEPR